MSLNITGNFFGQIKNSKQYQAAAKDFLSLHRQEVAAMSPEQKMMYELLGGEKGYMNNVMKNYNSDGDFTAGGIVVPGMLATGIPESERHQIINISEDARQMMFDNVKREFIKENGISNGNTTKRSEVFRKFQLSIPKEDRLKGTWTLQQYEGNYRSALYHAVKAADPNWEAGQPFDPAILDNITREDIEKNLVQSGNRLVKKSINCYA
ncbi:DUF3879 family protein [Clostridium sp. MD294]|uniref:DUF3879 family protein n=1 Tax=Clostridium sp. MD294 TaxID=97138 RepID=UPI0002CC18B1|nr:DUF3879 family protein [Clostridium sp. MD294]NDO47187.1 hypothetical protein [Clostridium sp. MD294]USF29750.1 hypothetical protein C820_001158 [Clostridium sp. MD294]